MTSKLSTLTDDMGILRHGRIESTDVPFDNGGATGVVIDADGVTMNTLAGDIVFHIFTVAAGVLGAGLNTLGEIVAGMGRIVIGASGIVGRNAAGDIQAQWDSETGSIVAGGGAITLDATGIVGRNGIGDIQAQWTSEDGGISAGEGTVALDRFGVSIVEGVLGTNTVKWITEPVNRDVVASIGATSDGLPAAGTLVIFAQTVGEAASTDAPLVRIEVGDEDGGDRVRFNFHRDYFMLQGGEDTPVILCVDRSNHPAAPDLGTTQLYSYGGAWYQQGNSGGPKRLLTEDDL